MCIVRFALHVKTCSFCLCFLLLLTLLWFLLCRLTAEEVESIEADTANRWQGVCISRASPTPSESAATVKSLIKSFDLGCSGMLYTVVGFFPSFWVINMYFLSFFLCCCLVEMFCQCLVQTYYLWNVTVSLVPCSAERKMAGFETQLFLCFFFKGSTGQNITVQKVPRSPLSGIPVRTAPAAAVSPMQVQGTLSITGELEWIDAMFEWHSFSVPTYVCWQGERETHLFICCGTSNALVLTKRIKVCLWLQFRGLSGRMWTPWNTVLNFNHSYLEIKF